MIGQYNFTNVMYHTKNIAAPALIKDIDGKKGIMTGYFAVFNNIDHDGDITVPGAFQKSVSEKGPNSSRPQIKHLRNHNIYEPIGVLQILQEDAKGLYYESLVGSHFIGQDTIKMAESGLITEHSFGYSVLRKEQKDGVRYLKELAIREGSSLTAWGANEATGPAMMKSMGKDAYFEMITKRAAAVEKFCRNSTATDETLELLLIECKQLTQIILDVSKNPTKPDNTTLPGAEMKSAINLFLNK